MSTEINWHIADRVLFIRLSGDVTLDAIAQTIVQSNAYYAVGRAPIYALVDFSCVERVPKNIDDYRGVFNLKLHDNLSYVIAYGIRNPFLSFLASLYTQTIRRELRIVQTYDEAMELIEKIEAKVIASSGRH